MNAYPDIPSRLHWTAQDLAAAVPLRLWELYRFDAGRTETADNAARFVRAPRPARQWHGGYVRPAPLPTRFCVRL